MLLLVFGVGAFLYIKAPDLVKTIMELLGFKPSTTASSEPLINAIRCSYYRCVEGCSSNKLNILIDGQNCNKTFCAPYIIDDGFAVFDKICDKVAADNPIPVTLDYETKITRDNFEWFSSKGGEIMYEDKSCVPPYTHENSIFIKGNLLIDTTKVLLGLGTITKAELKSGKYYIWTGDVGSGSNTIIWDSSCSSTGKENCCDGKDNDGDGLVDAWDVNDCGKGNILEKGENKICWAIKKKEPSGEGNLDSGWYSCPSGYIPTQVKVSGNARSSSFYVNVIKDYPIGGKKIVPVWGNEIKGSDDSPQIINLIETGPDLAKTGAQIQFMFRTLRGDIIDYVNVTSITCNLRT